MKRCHVGFWITGSALVLVHVWIWLCHYLVNDALWHHHNCVFLLHPGKITAMQIWNDVVVALDGQAVRWHWYMFSFECVIVWYTMRHGTIAITYTTAISIHYNGNDTRLCADVGWIHGTVSCWLCANRQCVGIGTFLNLQELLHNALFTITVAHLSAIQIH